jgi:hypothetical protein
VAAIKTESTDDPFDGTGDENCALCKEVTDDNWGECTQLEEDECNHLLTGHGCLGVKQNGECTKEKKSCKNQNYCSKKCMSYERFAKMVPKRSGRRLCVPQNMTQECINALSANTNTNGRPMVWSMHCHKSSGNEYGNDHWKNVKLFYDCWQCVWVDDRCSHEFGIYDTDNNEKANSAQDTFCKDSCRRATNADIAELATLAEKP